MRLPCPTAEHDAGAAAGPARLAPSARAGRPKDEAGDRRCGRNARAYSASRVARSRRPAINTCVGHRKNGGWFDRARPTTKPSAHAASVLRRTARPSQDDVIIGDGEKSQTKRGQKLTKRKPSPMLLEIHGRKRESFVRYPISRYGAHERVRQRTRMRRDPVSELYGAAREHKRRQKECANYVRKLMINEPDKGRIFRSARTSQNRGGTRKMLR